MRQENISGIRKMIFWSTYIGDQFLVWTPVLTVVLIVLFATVLAWICLMVGAPPEDFTLPFIMEAVVGVADRVLLLELVALAFTAVAEFLRWLLGQGKDRLVDPYSLAQGHPIIALFASLLQPIWYAFSYWTHPPPSLSYPCRRNRVLTLTSFGLVGVFPAWNRPPPAQKFSF